VSADLAKNCNGGTEDNYVNRQPGQLVFQPEF
jgi:hypothetical protein